MPDHLFDLHNKFAATTKIFSVARLALQCTTYHRTDNDKTDMMINKSAWSKDLFKYQGKQEQRPWSFPILRKGGNRTPEILLLVKFGCKGKTVPSLAINQKTDNHNKPHKIYAFEKQMLGKTWSTWKTKTA